MTDPLPMPTDAPAGSAPSAGRPGAPVARPPSLANRLDAVVETAGLFSSMRNPRVLLALGPAAVRGLVLRRGKQGRPTEVQAHHAARFDWTYPDDHPEMRALYERAKRNQWNASTDLPWETSVDPLDPTVPIVPDDFLDRETARRCGIPLDAGEHRRLTRDFACWALSQFLHGEQGALFAAAQVTESVQFFDGKLYGSTQVVDEGRHVEVFHRYLEEKLQKLYPVNDNLYVILDALLGDPRWDMKFLGMQIMIEGLALGAFGVLYQQTREPLLKALLRGVMRDEVRHVHYGVLALREHLAALPEGERREREDWALEVAILLKNRFLAYEVYDEWFAGTRVSRKQWRTFVTAAPGMRRFRHIMFHRLIPNLREIGLLTPRVRPRYEAAGLAPYFEGPSADRITEERLVGELEADRRPLGGDPP
jgi:hypothetical protein